MPKKITSSWFETLRNNMCSEFEKIESEYAKRYDLEAAKFKKTSWDRPGGGGGQMSVMKGNVFEKVGVNFSVVHGQLKPDFKKQMPGADEEGNFFATGISVVAHMKSPLLPASHFNTRYITTTKSWFGGGGDLNPTFPKEDETKFFHESFQKVCDKYDPDYYPKFKKECDEYFFIKHRNEPRGIGGIFFDYFNTENFDKDFNFIKDLGVCFKDTISDITGKGMFDQWSDDQKEDQLIKRGRYVEFNLLYDRGTRFGLETDGNINAIFMSLPPCAKWV